MAIDSRAIDNARHQIDSAAYNASETLLGGRPIFRRSSDPEFIHSIGRPAQSILGTFERTLLRGNSEALLVWPHSPDDVAVFHAIAAVNRLAECDGKGLATLFFPWGSRATAIQRRLLVDRDFICESTLPAISRVWPESGSHPAFNYLMALHSLRHVLASGKKDKKFRIALTTDLGLEHPNLFEVMPQRIVKDSDSWGYEGQFLRRLRSHTWIADCPEHLEGAVDPLRTPFFFFGVHPNALKLPLFRNAGLDPLHRGRRPDVVLIDLTRRARNRLGGDWRVALDRLLVIFDNLYSRHSPPLLAVTDDAFVLQRLRWDVLKPYDIRRGVETPSKGPAFSRLVLQPKPDPLDHETIVPGLIPEFAAELYGTDVLTVVEDGLKLRRALLDNGEPEIADAVLAAVSALRNVVSLPGPPPEFHQFLADNYDGYERASIGARFDFLAPSGRIRSALGLGLAGVNHNWLEAFRGTFDNLCVRAGTENAGCKLFEKCLRNLVCEDVRTILVFPNEIIRTFAEWRIENDNSLSFARPALGSRLLLVDRRQAVNELDVGMHGKTLFGRLVFVEPHADDLLHVLTRSWLPEKVLILANLAWADYTRRRIKILLQLDGIEALKDKFINLLAELERALEGRRIEIPDLDIPPPLPRLGRLDLTTTGTAGSGSTRVIETSGHLHVKAFDGTEIALYEPEALQVFSRRLAKDIKSGDQICLLSPEFVSMVREKLSLTANASEVLPLYHRSVAEAATNLPGGDMTSKARDLRARMLESQPASDLPEVQAIRQWIDVEAYVDSPLHEIRPHAPRDRKHYLCFMEALGIGEELAQQYWDWGIIWTRSIRIRSGFMFHQVFMGMLIDPHGTASRLPESRRHDVWRIYETAEEHVVTVISNRRENESCI